VGEFANGPNELRDTGPVMSEEPTTPDVAELTRRQFEAGRRGDLDAVLGFYAPDAVWEAVSLDTSFEGVAAIRGFLEDWLGAYDEFEMEPEEILDLGNGVVFVVTRLTGRPLGSLGGTLTRRRPLVFLWVQGLVARVTAPSSDIDEARAAAERLAEPNG
jgi:ketosteroid isomerase-like protein